MLNLQQLAAILSCLCFCSCGLKGYIKTPPPTQPHVAPLQKVAQGKVRIHVFSHGWHTGIVLPGKTLRRHAWTKDLKIAKTNYVEFGWGAEEFYRRPDITLPMIIRGLGWSTPAIVHVERFPETPYQHYPHSQLAAFDVSKEEVGRLINLLEKGFSRTSDGQHLVDLGKGVEKDSSMFRSKGGYYYPETCNVWTARLLTAAGIEASGSTRAPKLMRELKTSPKRVPLPSDTP